MLSDLALLFISAALVNNFLLVRFLGICPFLGVTKQVETALGMGAAVVFVMGLSGVVTWGIQNYILVPLNVEFLQYAIFILVIAVLVQFLEMFIKRANPALYDALGIFLPLITTNCAILGLALLLAGDPYNLIEAIVFSIGSGIGFTIAMVIMAGIRQELEFAEVPENLQGSALALLIASIMSMSFVGFGGLI